MTRLFDSATEIAIYNWVVAGMPAGWTVIWSDPKEQTEKAPRPAYPYAVMKISDGGSDAAMSIRWKENRINITAANTTTTVTVDDVAYTVTVTPPATRTTAQLATDLAALLNAALASKLTATTLGSILILTRVAGQTFDTVATANCTLTPAAGGIAQDVFTHTQHGSFTLSIEAHTRDGGHMSALKNLIRSKAFAASMKILRDAGLGFWQASDLRDISFLYNTEFVHVAQADIDFGYADTVDETTGQIDRLELTATLTTQKGEAIPVTQTITI